MRTGGVQVSAEKRCAETCLRLMRTPASPKIINQNVAGASIAITGGPSLDVWLNSQLNPVFREMAVLVARA
jgi:hypothetical protein